MSPNINIKKEADKKCIIYCKKILGYLDNVVVNTIFTLDTCISNCSKLQEQKRNRKK